MVANEKGPPTRTQMAMGSRWNGRHVLGNASIGLSRLSDFGYEIADLSFMLLAVARSMRPWSWLVAIQICPLPRVQLIVE